MYTPSWLSDQSLTAALQQEPWRWQSSQAIRVLSFLGESVEQRCDSSYCYPVAELCRVKRHHHGWLCVSTSPALSGYHGVLPYCYQDIEQYQKQSQDSSGLFDFLSGLSSRILSQGSRVALRSRVTARYESVREENALASKHMLSLSGLPMPQKIPVDNLVRYSAVLARKTTNLALLASLLRDYFSFDVHLEPPPVVRMPLAKDCLTKLVCSYTERRGQYVVRLGENSLIGRSGYLLHSCINVVISARTVDEYQSIVEDPDIAPAILEMCTIYFSSPAHFRLQIQCPRRFLDPPRLSAQPTGSVARLGRMSCLLPELKPQQLITIDYPGDIPDQGASYATA